MKKFSYRLAGLILAIGLALSLGACGGSGADSMSSSSAAQSIGENYSSDKSAGEVETGEAAEEDEASQPLASAGRKLITTCFISAEAEDYDGAMAWLEDKLAEAGGYTESSEIYAYNFDSRSCHLVLRVPAGRLEGFLAAVDERCNVVERSIQEDDVTLNYVDTESHKEALLVEQERLMELLSRAQKLEDILSIEDRLTQVRYELQNYESALRAYDSQIEYSTVNIDLREVKEITEPAPETWGSRAWRGMRDNAKGILRFFQELGLLIVSSLPTLGVLAVVVAIVLICTRKPRRAAKERRKRNREYIEAMQKESIQKINQEKK